MTTTYTYTKHVLGREIKALVFCTDDGVNVSVAGGDRSHIGAVSVVDGRGNMQTTTFPAHKETVIAEEWAQRLYELLHQPVVVSAGIHYDGITRDGIEEVVTACRSLLSIILTDAA